MDNYLLLLLFIGFAAVAVGEMALSGTWKPWFFRTGIVLFRKRFSYPASLGEADIAQAEARFSGWVAPAFLFRRIGPGEYAFRERFIQFTLLGYVPLMHGQISIDEQEGTVTVTGRAYWSHAAFGLIFGIGLGFAGRHVLLPFLLSLVLMYAILYAVQVYRFTRVGRFLSSTLCESPDDEATHRNNMTPG